MADICLILSSVEVLFLSPPTAFQSSGLVLYLFVSPVFLMLLRRWTCESGAYPFHSDQPQRHGTGCGHLQCSGHCSPGSVHPLCHLLQEAAPGEKAW